MWNSEEKLGQVEEHPCGCVSLKCLWILLALSIHMAKVKWRKWFWHRDWFLGSNLALLLLDTLVLSPDLLAKRQLLCLCLWDSFSCTPPTKTPKVTASCPWKRPEKQHFHRNIHYQVCSCTITLQIKSFSYKCANVIELIASFLRVINKQTLSKGGKGQGRDNRQQDMEQKKLKVHKNLRL